MPLRVTILGSGTIIPSLERRATALLVETGEQRFLFDCGPCVLEALEEAGTSFHSLERIFITHYHPDHTLGIGHLLSAINNDRDRFESAQLVLYGPRGLEEFMERLDMLYRSLVMKSDYLRLVEIDEGALTIEGESRIGAVRADHGERTALSYRMDHGGVSFVYTGDTAYTERLVEFAREADLLVTECSFPDDQAVPGHLTPGGVGSLASKAGVGGVVLVHMYPRFGDSDPAASVRKHYNGPVVVASDGMTIDL
ncbi:MAG: MBL fold metallo-hydrolase [bacterium]|nr:MAG: MBL fold metallo-hydrolase [bacterium]